MPPFVPMFTVFTDQTSPRRGVRLVAVDESLISVYTTAVCDPITNSGQRTHVAKLVVNWFKSDSTTFCKRSCQ